MVFIEWDILFPPKFMCFQFSYSEVHCHVHGPLHGLLQPRLQGIRRKAAERERKHVSHLDWREIQDHHSGLCIHSANMNSHRHLLAEVSV